MNRYDKQLRKMCNSRGYSLYGMEMFRQIKPYVDWELQRIMEISEGAKDFVEMAEFMDSIKRYHSKLGGKSCRYGFRGSVGASIVAYLCGITEYEPSKFQSWTFFAKNSGVILFDLNVTMDLYNQIMDYYSITIPPCVVLHVGVDISILERIEKQANIACYDDIANWTERNWTKQEEKYNAEIALFCQNDTLNGTYSKFRYLNDFKDRYLPQIAEIFEFLKSKDKLPSTIEELMRLDGFVHSSFYDPEMTHLQWLQECEDFAYEELISYPEDIYDRLVNAGCPEYKAIAIAGKFQEKNVKLVLDDLITLTDYCGEEYMRAAEKIAYLYCRPHCFEMSVMTVQMMHYINTNFTEFKYAYDSIC